MKIALTKELEAVLREQIETGLYKDAGEVIRNAIRQTYCPSEPDPYLDSQEIARKIRHARKGKYPSTSHGGSRPPASEGYGKRK